MLLLTVFLSSSNPTSERTTPAALKTKFEALGLTPLSRKDILAVLLNPFVEKYSIIIEYAKTVIGLNSKEVSDLVEEVALKCLEVQCKGKLLKRLVEDFPGLKNKIASVVLENYSLGLEDLPSYEDEEACAHYHARLCRDHVFPRLSAMDEYDEEDVVMDGFSSDEEVDHYEEDEDELDELSNGGEPHADGPELVSELVLCNYFIWLKQVM